MEIVKDPYRGRPAGYRVHVTRRLPAALIGCTPRGAGQEQRAEGDLDGGICGSTPVSTRRGAGDGPRRASRRGLASLAAIAGMAVLVPAPVAAHTLTGRVDTPLPFAAYVIGAALAVAISFAFVAISDAGPPRDTGEGRRRTVPAWLRLALRAVGLVGWGWIVLQALVGGTSAADVASLFLWIYGWVLLPIVSALIGPVWPWLDPFSTLHDLGAALGRRLGIRGVSPRPYPAALGAWAAAIGLAAFVWLELVARVEEGRPLGFVLIGYTIVTLLGMLQFGRDAWRANAEVFGVWLGVLGRLAPYALDGDPDEGRVRRRPYASGLLSEPWSFALLAIVAVGTGSIIYDGLSQTQVFFEVFRFPALPVATLLLAAFLAALVGIVLWVARRVGLAPMGAGLVPVALGYLVAHYLSLLLIDGQRIAVAISDPLQQGWDLLGTAFWEPREDLLPVTVMWTIQVGAVVVGHVVGAWAGHAAIRAARPATSGAAAWVLALFMIGLTSLTLWSLGQNLVFEPAPVVSWPGPVGPL
jgi:hypothetical protein